MSRPLCFLRNTYKSKDEFSHAARKDKKILESNAKARQLLGFAKLSRIIPTPRR